MLTQRIKYGGSRSLVVVFIAMLGVFTGPAAKAADEHQIPKGQGKRPGIGHLPSGNEEGEEKTCQSSPSDLAAFANGESYHFKSLVNYLASPICASSSQGLAQAALAEGVRFSAFPFHLDVIGNNFSKLTLEGASRVDSSLSQTVPSILRANPLSSRELYPLVGQLAILSPAAGRVGLSQIIQQELIAGDDLLNKNKKNDADIAKQLMRMGASEEKIVTQLAADIEDRALSAEADSLAKIFRSLTAAALTENALLPTLNISAGALNRGIGLAADTYERDQKKAMTKSVFSAIDVTAMGGDPLIPAAGELNEAFGKLVQNQKLDSAFWKRIWRDAIRVLAHSKSQPVLAEAMGKSFTTNLAYLSKADLEVMIEAAAHYPVIAFALEANLLLAINQSWEELQDEKLTVTQFNSRRKLFFEPLVSRILTLDPDRVDPEWLKEVLRHGLVKDDSIEKRFPLFVVFLQDSQQRLARTAVLEGETESTLQLMSGNFRTLWSVSRVHIPALNRWVEKNESE